MRVKELLEPLGCTVLTCPEGLEKEVAAGYCCDLLSWVIGRAGSHSAWLTVMTNQNVVAVAVMAEISCIVITEGAQPEAEVLESATKNGVTLLSTGLSTFAAASALGKLL
ncbi:MAG TPA: DRTGG domain-containing protein [Candidatus Acidoferrum sp.]|nr:DRTGG domain-containing protein [Candidatus Acidoferrum sp.]